MIHNITDIFHNIDSWGYLAAKTGSEKYNIGKYKLIEKIRIKFTWKYITTFAVILKKKKHIDEIHLQQGFLNNVLGNKEIQRAISKFDGGLSLLRPQIDGLLKSVYTKYQYLWSDDLEQRVMKFVDADPYPSEIEDEFVRCQLVLDELDIVEKLTQINCIAVDLSEGYDRLSEYARNWKRKLAEVLANIYKDKFDEINDFIRDTDSILRRELKDDEDFTATIECLLNVYKNSER